jgi:Transposase, Mutator family
VIGLAACAHAFGYRGHCLTKSWGWSVRFKDLREDRERELYPDVVDGLENEGGVPSRLMKTDGGEDDRVCLLVVLGVREDGEKELLAVEDGYRESTDSWAAVMRDLKTRGLNEPKLVTGDGALGVWAALRDVFPVPSPRTSARGCSVCSARGPATRSTTSIPARES